MRYGFVGGVAGEIGPVMVMLDGELGGDVIELSQLEPVSITSVELHLDGGDLIDDPELRQGLVRLWQAEAESAGLAVDAVHGLGRGEWESIGPSGSWSLAELASGGDRYVVRAMRAAHDPGVVCVRADRLS